MPDPFDPKPLRLGILGCATIARQFARDVAGSPAATIVAVASRDAARARDFAETFGIPRHFDSYEALLADPEIDAIYNPLPNSLHAPWSIKAAEHGKHILCEKPLATSLAEAKAMFAAARRHNVMLLEGFPYWFQPQTAAMLQLIEGGEAAGIGEVRHVQAGIGFTVRNPVGNIRFSAELSGGALFDAGCYPLSFIRLVMGAAPVRVQAEASWDASGVDLSIMATLTFGDGRRAQMSAAMDTAHHRKGLVIGTHGIIESEYLNHIADAPGHPLGFPVSPLRVRRGSPAAMPSVELHSPGGSGFRFALEAFARMVGARDGAAIARYEAISLDLAATLEACAKSARSGQSVAL